MKGFMKWLGKRMVNALVTGVLFIGVVLGIVYALTYPSAPPVGEVAGGKFMTYFDKIFQGTCGANQAISGYDASKNPICVATGTGVNGGGWIDVPLTDTADFDINYEWMFIMHNSNDNLSYASYAGVVHPSLVRVGGISYVICPGSKNILRDGAFCTGVHHVGNTITNIQKRKVNVTGALTWTNVPLTDTADFDTNCMYRFTMTTETMTGLPGGAAGRWLYASGIGPKVIIYSAHSSVTSHVNSTTKSSYRINGVPGYTVGEMQKNCY